MSVELHLPDLPEVPISLGPADQRPGQRAAMPWHARLRESLSAYLPLLLMTLLALATWWLVKNSPRAPELASPRVLSNEPDYSMEQFAVERFDAKGRLKLRIEGARLRHFPATDRIEVEAAQIRAIAPDGRVTLAHAQRALGNGDGSEVQLLGGAEVSSVDATGTPLVMRSEFLHAFFVTERVKSHLPVMVQSGGNELQVAGLDYDHVARRLDFKGPLRAALPPRPNKGAAKGAVKTSPAAAWLAAKGTTK
jgi:lipopolysaccharide export system protein LptC